MSDFDRIVDLAHAKARVHECPITLTEERSGTVEILMPSITAMRGLWREVARRFHVQPRFIEHETVTDIVSGVVVSTKGPHIRIHSQTVAKLKKRRTPEVP